MTPTTDAHHRSRRRFVARWRLAVLGALGALAAAVYGCAGAGDDRGANASTDDASAAVTPVDAQQPADDASAADSGEPDGDDGSGTLDVVASGGDPVAGASAYAAQCATCHGAERQGGSGPALRLWPRDLNSLEAVIHHSMPPQDPTQCGAGCAADIRAFLFGAFEADCDLPPRRLRLLNRREWAASVEALLPEPAPAAPPPCATAIDCAPLPAASAGEAQSACVAGVCAPAACGVARFVLEDPSPSWSTVLVAGPFNGWNADPGSSPHAMAWDAGSKRWWLDIATGEGAVSYKFVAFAGDGGANWLVDPANPATEDNGIGGQNSVLTVGCGGLPDGGAAAPIDVAALAATFPVESRPEGYAFDVHAGALVTPVHVEQVLAAAAQIASARAPDVVKTHCAAMAAGPEADQTCAEAITDSLLPRALRRPPTDAERARYIGHFSASPAPGMTRAERVTVGLQILLSSPLFLYRSEVGTPAPAAGVARLSPWEVATELAYLLTGRGPDDALMKAAADGTLQTAAGVEAEARRLLDSAAARPIIRAFALQWLGVERVRTADKHPGLHPGFKELREAMADETATLAANILLDSPGHDWRQLLLVDHTFANDALAAHYGDLGASESAGAATGSTTGARKRPLLHGRRAGVLGHGSVLASYAHSDQTSPIRRGLFVRQRLLCHDFPPPPPDAGGVPDIDPNATTRERFAQHSADPACKACHQYIDDLGFGFERFDAAGGWRETENGAPIDPSGQMNDVEARGVGTEAPFESLPTLAATLAASDAAQSCFATQWLRFARGEREGPATHCELAELRARFQQSGGDARELLVALTQLPGFFERRLTP